MTYRLDFDHENYFNLDLDIFALKKTVGKSMGRSEFKQYWLNNTSLKEHWQDIGAKWVDVGLNNDAPPDITVWNGPHLVLNAKALEAFKEILPNYGECMPLTIDGQLHTLFYCMRDVDVDPKNSESDVVEGVWMGIKSIAFEKSTALTNVVFKTQFDRCRGLYCNDDFKAVCEQNNLSGLIFADTLEAS